MTKNTFSRSFEILTLIPRTGEKEKVMINAHSQEQAEQKWKAKFPTRAIVEITEID